jgi:hypothetical protein
LLTKFERIRSGNSFGSSVSVHNNGLRNSPSGNSRYGRAAGRDCYAPAFLRQKPRAPELLRLMQSTAAQQAHRLADSTNSLASPLWQ